MIVASAAFAIMLALKLIGHCQPIILPEQDLRPGPWQSIKRASARHAHLVAL
jgi:hypothetical protein